MIRADTEVFLAREGPANLFVSKGGNASNTNGRACICNALIATADVIAAIAPAAS